MSLTSLFDTACNVERQTATPDAVGSNTPTWAARLSNIACSVQPSSTTATPRLVQDFSRMDFVMMFVVHTAADLKATTQDRIVILAGPFAGTYPVVGYQIDANAVIAGEILYSTYVIKRN